jgi:Arylsulfotransferase (ASST)
MSTVGDEDSAQLSRSEFFSTLGRAAAGGVALLYGDALLGVADALASPTSEVMAFVSRPDLRPPRLRVVRRGAPGSGYLFLSPSSGPGQRGPMIIDNDGNLVWFLPTTPQTAMNLRVGHYRGQAVISWWEGKAERGLGTGTHVILDDHYQTIARLPAGGGRQSDLHEFVITDRNTALVTSYEVRAVDLSAVGGPAGGAAIGGIVQELALPSGRVLFEWRSLDHVGIDETHIPWDGRPLDYFHVNSIAMTHDGHLLVSARNTWGVYKINRRTGDVIWRLGGKKSDFRMGRGTVFAWQHDAREAAPGRITIFDDGAQPQVAPQSRALIIGLDHHGRTARLVRKFTHRPGRIVSRFMGNAQLLPNGNMLVGWGSEPFITEFAPDGRIVLDAQLPRGGQNYRALRFPWRALPDRRPEVAYRYRRGQGHLYVSWNGATEVDAWRLEMGTQQSALRAGNAVARAGFETALAVPHGMRWGRAVALDRDGNELRRSRIVRI